MPLARSSRACGLLLLFAILAAASLFLLTPNPANAGRLLGYLRNYDLNEYALGVAYSTLQNPYAGSENSTIAYPWLADSFAVALLQSAAEFKRRGSWRHTRSALSRTEVIPQPRFLKI
jgi:hypothetical protein